MVAIFCILLSLLFYTVFACLEWDRHFQFDRRTSVFVRIKNNQHQTTGDEIPHTRAFHFMSASWKLILSWPNKRKVHWPCARPSLTFKSIFFFVLFTEHWTRHRTLCGQQRWRRQQLWRRRPIIVDSRRRQMKYIKKTATINRYCQGTHKKKEMEKSETKSPEQKRIQKWNGRNRKRRTISI